MYSRASRIPDHSTLNPKHFVWDKLPGLKHHSVESLGLGWSGKDLDLKASVPASCQNPVASPSYFWDSVEGISYSLNSKYPP